MTIKRSTISRRQALAGAATAGLSVPLLAACGDDADPETSDPTSSATERSAPPDETSTTASSAQAGDGIPVSDVPVGGGIVLSDEQVVITQPAEGEFHAFTAICTHAGCPVARVTTEIECDCHGSRYSIEDGSVVGGPAPAPLAAADFAVSGDRITLG
jgi:Rieske Fe-S protein